MILGHYILWRLAGENGPVELYYVIAMVVASILMIEVIDRIRKLLRKKKHPNG